MSTGDWTATRWSPAAGCGSSRICQSINYFFFFQDLYPGLRMIVLCFETLVVSCVRQKTANFENVHLYGHFFKGPRDGLSWYTSQTKDERKTSPKAQSQSIKFDQKSFHSVIRYNCLTLTNSFLHKNLKVCSIGYLRVSFSVVEIHFKLHLFSLFPSTGTPKRPSPCWTDWTWTPRSPVRRIWPRSSGTRRIITKVTQFSNRLGERANPFS